MKSKTKSSLEYMELSLKKLLVSENVVNLITMS